MRSGETGNSEGEYFLEEANNVHDDDYMMHNQNYISSKRDMPNINP